MQTLREYETIYILRPDIADESMAQVNDRLDGVLEREGARILRRDVWGKKKTAFEVKKHPKGIYISLTYLGEPAVIREFERNLRLLEPVIRYQTKKIAEDVDVEKRLAEQAAADRAREAAEAEARAREEARAAEEAAAAAARATEQSSEDTEETGEEQAADDDASAGEDEE